MEMNGRFETLNTRKGLSVRAACLLDAARLASRASDLAMRASEIFSDVSKLLSGDFGPLEARETEAATSEA